MSDPGQHRAESSKELFNLEGLRKLFESRIAGIELLQTERDKRYEDRFSSLDKATEKALTAVKEQTAAAFAANKESVIKTEEAQKAYNSQHNDLTRKMETQAGQFVSRERLEDVVKRFDAQVETLKSAIVQLQSVAAAGGARREVVQEHRQQTNWTISQLIAIVLAIAIPLAGLIVMLLRGKP